MARRINVTETTATTTGATYTFTIGTHIANDLLLACLSQDGGSVNISLGNTVTTLTAATDLCTATSMIFADGDQIEITTSGNLTGTGLAISTRYWVRDSSGSTFKLAASAGGAAIDITGTGSGTHTFHLMSDVSSGWAMVGTQKDSQGVRQAWVYKIASGAGTSAPTMYGTSDDWMGTCIVYRDADTTTPIEGWMRSDWGVASTAVSNTIAASSAGGTTVITPSADSLIVYSWCTDGGNGIQMRTKLSDAIGVSKRADATPAVGHIICQNQLTSASVPSVTMYSSIATEGGNGWVLSIKNASGGALQKQARVTATENSGLSSWCGNFSAIHGAITWQKLSTFVAAAGGVQSITINGVAITASDVALGTVTTNGVQNKSPWGTISSIPHATDATVLAGAWRAITPENLSGKIVTFNYQLDTASTSGRIGTEGMLCGFRSSDGNYAIYQLRTKSNGWSVAEGLAAFIDLGNSTPIATLGSIDFTAIDGFAIMWHRDSGSTGQADIGIHNISVVTSASITGGGASDPANFKVLADDLESWGFYRWADLQGLTQVVAKFNVQIGNGTHATYFDSAPAFEFPRAYSETSREWNVAASRVSVDIYAKSGDTINFAAGVAASESLQGLTINASSSTGATYSFAGESFIGYTPRWLAGISCANATFKQCATVDFKGSAPNTVFVLTPSSTINSSTGAACSFDANSSMTNCTTSCTKEDGTTTGYHIELGTAVTAFTLTDHTFSGTATTDKIHVLKTTGTVTITISGTTALSAGDVTSAGATVVISAPELYQSVVVSGFTAGSRIQIYDTTNSAELFNGTATAGNTVVSGTTATWTDPTPAAGTRAIRVRVAYVSVVTAKQFIETSGLTCGVTEGTESVTYPITQVADTTYDSNGVDGPTIYAGSGVTFTDAATDLVNINVGVAGTVSLQTVYACFVYWMFTAAGIDDDVAYIDAPDPANYILTSMKFRNTSATPLKITGGYFYDSTGSVENCVDDAGSTGNIYPMPAHVVAYATGSGALTAGDITNIWSAATRTITTTIPTASDVATQVLTSAQSTPIYADVRKVTGVTVTGVGTEADPWGP